MEFYLIYMLFATTTSVVSIYELVWPVLRELEADGKDLNKFLYVLIFLGINILVAPLIFLSCIIPSFSERFRTALKAELSKVD